MLKKINKSFSKVKTVKSINFSDIKQLPDTLMQTLFTFFVLFYPPIILLFGDFLSTPRDFF